MLLSYDSLLTSRINYRNGKARGFEWQAVKMPATKLEQYDQGVPQTIGKIIALALKLELPVGEWVGHATKRELDINPVARDLLLSNIADETVHYKAFEYAAQDYLYDDNYLNEAQLIYDGIDKMSDHPLYKSYYCEIGAFLVSLAVLRVFGGETLAFLGANVSRDEYRHVAGNGGVLRDLGFDIYTYAPIRKKIVEILDWLLFDLCVPGLNKKFFMEQSKLLIEDGRAPELEMIVDGANDYSLFEHSNVLLY